MSLSLHVWQHQWQAIQSQSSEVTQWSTQYTSRSSRHESSQSNSLRWNAVETCGRSDRVDFADVSCSAVDFISSRSKAFIASINSAIEGRRSDLTALLVSKDPYPLEFNNKTLDMQTVPFFGYSFTLTPMLSHVSVKGIKNLAIRHDEPPGRSWCYRQQEALCRRQDLDHSQAATSQVAPDLPHGSTP